MIVTVNIDIIWLVIGIVIGFLCGGTLLCILGTGEQWNIGFSKGWNAGIKYERNKKEGMRGADDE